MLASMVFDYAHALTLFAITEFFLSLAPGPAVFLVISKSLGGRFGAGMAVTAGIMSVNAVFFLLSALGVGAAIVAAPWLFMAIKVSGAAYLAYLGGRGLYDVWRASRVSQDMDAVAVVPVASTSFRSDFMAAVLVQASSPKNIIIFLAIIPQFVDPAGPVFLQFAALCVVSLLVELPILAGYAALAVYLVTRVKQARIRNGLECLAGVTLLVLGASLLFTGLPT
ncbi:MAG: LysE family translocator [Candidatus Puniceispirillum sp.]|jgi:homoserine/homoserine lactone efflux protein|uniref:LysE family translocator n=1 Tax=Candidatus Puniceispirillum sp. TaxID=2026719 RepID=UPI001EC9C0B1|nr:LysE family translocator [Candidatus Puniceispirillum sp.]MBT6416781.1 LysE family translocator [Candidatus Puniceispirillum sp.]MBT6566200.1 LysE family translocator [Candidatus Puniceispirillum sp.]